MRSLRAREYFPAVLALSALAASGCATMSREECLAVDWRTIGYEDGVAGYPGDRIAQHRKACAEHGVRSDLDLYQAGRAQGLREYCQPANGYRLGLGGGDYRGVCPVDLEGDFVGAFEGGRQLRSLEARVSSARAQLGAKRRELERVQQGMVANAVTAVGSDTSKEDRAEAVVDATQLAERAGRLKEEIRQLEGDTVRYQRDLDEYLAQR